MSVPFSRALMGVVAILVFLFSGCNENEDSLPTPTPLPMPVANTPAAVNVPTATLSSPLLIASPTAFSSPLPMVEPTVQLTVPDVYTGAYPYTITYLATTWRLETIQKTEHFSSPELVHHAIDGCRIILRDLPQGLTPGAIIGEKRLGGVTWSMANEPHHTPNEFTYAFSPPELGISYIIRLETPPEASDEVKAACQLAAEAVLDTFSDQ
jgi:hypothetical protein